VGDKRKEISKMTAKLEKYKQEFNDKELSIKKF
jgi:hypothetical protein